MEDRHKRVNPESRPAGISNLKSVKAVGMIDFRAHSFPYYVILLFLRIKECKFLSISWCSSLFKYNLVGLAGETGSFN